MVVSSLTGISAANNDHRHSKICDEKPVFTKRQAILPIAFCLPSLPRSGACEVCGKLGQLREGGWIKTLCDQHASTESRNLIARRMRKRVQEEG
jgi:hypothetical protein